MQVGNIKYLFSLCPTKRTIMITIICGTNRENSVSKQLALHYAAIVRQKGETAEVLSLEDMPHDFIGSALYENSGKNESFNEMREAMLAAQKMVFIVPEYNGSFPGVLKTFIDGLAFPGTFKEKKCALVGLSSGVQGGGLALSHLTDIFNYCGTNVLAFKPKLARIEANFVEGKLSPLYQELLEEQVGKLIAF